MEVKRLFGNAAATLQSNQTRRVTKLVLIVLGLVLGSLVIGAWLKQVSLGLIIGAAVARATLFRPRGRMSKGERVAWKAAALAAWLLFMGKFLHWQTLYATTSVLAVLLFVLVGQKEKNPLLEDLA